MNKIWNKIKTCIVRHKICLMICFCLGSCSPLANLDRPCPYAGVRADWNLLTHTCPDVGCLGELFIMPFAFIELPFAFVVDTTLAPIQSVRWLFSKEQRQQCEQIKFWF